jgi:phosphonate transport system substrate-binding protein
MQMRISRKKAVQLFVLCLAVLLLFACTENEKQESTNAFSGKNVPAPSFVIALLPQRNVFLQKKHYNVLADYLSKSIDMNVKTKLFDSYNEIYEEMLEGKVDAAFLGGLSYVVINSKISLEPIARPYLKNGTSTYKGVIFTMKDRGISGEVTTWKDKRIALVNKSSNSGYIFPRWYLYHNGVKDIESYFKSIIYSGSGDSSVTTVFQGEADIGCASDRIFNEVVGKNPLMREKLIIIASSPPLPYNTFSMRKSADHTLKARLKEALLHMDKTPGGRNVLSMLNAIQFIETKGSEYRPLSGMLNDLGLKPGDFALEFIEIPHLTPEILK